MQLTVCFYHGHQCYLQRTFALVHYRAFHLFLYMTLIRALRVKSSKISAHVEPNF